MTLFRRSFPLALLAIAAAALILAACSPSTAEEVPVTEPQPLLPTDPPEIAPTPTDIAEDPAPELGPAQTSAECEDPFGDELPEQYVSFFLTTWDQTNFCLHSIPYNEITPVLPPDRIPSIDAPVFESIEEGDAWLEDDWPVMFFEWNGDARAYPLAILIWHEIVNDVVGDKPVALTFCPLCNATIAFDRELPDGTVLDFGTTGSVRHSDLVMYDRLTESWWQQFTGEAIVGEMLGTQLEFLPSQIIGWGDFKASHPEGLVLSRDTGAIRSYGSNPYPGYDSINNSPFLFSGETDGRLAAMERVVAVTIGETDVAYPFSALADVGVVNDEIAELPIVVFWKTGTKSAFEQGEIGGPAVVGSSAVFERELEGQLLTFEALEDGTFEDLETGSRWSLLGEALEGPLAGEKLEPVVSAEHFWFAWAVFKPETRIWSAESG